MRAILFFLTLLFSANSFSATAITLNGLSWKHLNAGHSYESTLSFYESCGSIGTTCGDEGWRWANQIEVNQLVSDFYNVDIKDRYNNDILLGNFFDYFSHNIIESGTKSLIFYSSDLISSLSGADRFGAGGGNIISQDILSGPSPFNRVSTSRSGATGYDYENLKDWYYDSGVNWYTFSFMLVKGEYDPTLGITYPVNPSAVPLPASLFLFAPALLGFMGLRRKLP